MHQSHQSRVWVVLAALYVTLILGGCEKKLDPVVGPDTPPPFGGTISDEVRLATLDTLSSVIDRLSGVDPAADRQAVLSYLKSRPEFEDAGLSPDGGNVWGRFIDGRLFLFLNNRSPGSGPVAPQVMGGRIDHQLEVLNKTSDSFPGSSSARILNSLGTAFPGSQQSVDSIRTWCKKVGYTLSTPIIPSVANLAKMSGDGIFYWTAHGGTGYNRDLSKNPIFAMWTSDQVSAANEKNYKAYMDSTEVVYASAVNDIVAGKKAKVVHYMVTMKFIGKYMSFAPNSLVYFDACGSGGFDPAYRPALKSAGFYLGWSLPTYDNDADRTARYFFDRALGVNMQTPKMSPPQRPFFVGDILNDMYQRGYDKSGNSQLAHPLEQIITTLRLLAPSIGLTYGKGDVSSPLYTIGGSFAENPGAFGVVLLNNKPVTISSWTPTEVKIQKPQGGGTLVVTVRDVKSNPVTLTEWSGTLDYTYTGRGTLKQHIVINLKFWADVHSFRPNIIMPSMYVPIAGMGRPVEWMKTSSCSYEASGEFKDSFGEVQETWQGGATLPMGDLGSDGSVFSGSALIDSAGTNSALFIVMTGKYTRWLKGTGESQLPLNFNVVNIDLKHSMPSFAIQGGSMSVNGGTLTWTDMPASFPPDPKAAQ